MFRILVADDEKVTRRGIVTMLERGMKEEIEFIEASNGEEALQIVKQQMIHLVITDICMPLCSGLEFVRQLRKNDDDMTVIIVSGYENFEYAKQAVKLGVKDYIMKPLKREELLGLVESCIADIRKKQVEMQQFWKKSQEQDMLRKELEREVLLYILHGINIHVGIQRLELLNIRFEDPFLLAAVISYEGNQETDEQMELSVKTIVDECLEARFNGKFYNMTDDHGKIAVIFHFSEMSQNKYIEKTLLEIVHLIEKKGRMKALAGVGEMVFKLEELHRSYNQANIASDCKIFNTGEKLITYAALPKSVSGTGIAVNGIANYVTQGEQKILEKFQDLLKQGKSVDTILELRRNYDGIRKYCNERQKNNEIYAGKRFSELWSDFELRREIKEMVQCMADAEGEDAVRKRQIIRDITAFVRQHVTEDIDLNFIAETFGKTPGYIGTLFRRENNQGFNEFVTGERMEIAKKLLKDHSISVQKVGEMCGYYNPKYFSIVFKKAEGISPKAYQMMQKRED